MLVIGRKEGESIRIGGDVVVTLVRAGHQVRLGIQAPATVRITRTELMPTRDELGEIQDRCHGEQE